MIGQVARILFRSIAYQYFPREVQNRINAHMKAVGKYAAIEALLAWVSFGNIDEDGPCLRLETWPDGDKRILAKAGAHVQSLT